MHRNMFEWGGDRRGVYEAFNRDYKRDSRTLQIFDAVAGLAVVYLAVRHLEGLDTLAACAAYYCGVSGLRYFTDQSARNFLMHHLDWSAAGPDDARD